MQSVAATKELMEALSARLLNKLAPSAWYRQFMGEGKGSVRFGQRALTLVHVDADAWDLAPMMGSSVVDPVHAELSRITAQYGGQLDGFGTGTALAAFADPFAAVRMAVALQRRATQKRLHVGVASGLCVIGEFESEGRRVCTAVGALPERAARVAASAIAGSIVISPETYGPLEERLDAEVSGCLVMQEFMDSDMPQATITFTPPKSAAVSTFAGLGLTS